MVVILGTEGADELFGGSGRDFFDGLDGSDTYLVFADSNLDFYQDTGVSGTDRIVAAGDHVEIMLTGPFDASNGIEVISGDGHIGVAIRGTGGADRYDFRTVDLVGIKKLELGAGEDLVRGSMGGDDIRGGNGSDRIFGAEGDDTLQGGGPNDMQPLLDHRHGRDGDDYLDGGKGNDFLAGGADNDTLVGGAGADTLYGGTGVDVLQGDGWRDTFRWMQARDGGDTVVDFQPLMDVIDIVSIDSNTAVRGNQAFSFAGESQTAVANSVTYFVENGNTIVQLDRTGDTGSDFEITLIGEFQLAADDFLL